MVSPFALRTLAGVVFLLCSTVVLGISIHVESNIRQFGVSTATFTYDAFLGAFTILLELIFLGLRLVSPTNPIVSFAGESILSFILFIMWLAATIATFHFTQDDRSVCKHLNDLFDLPEFEGVDKEVLNVAKKAMRNACRELKAELAFIVISLILAALISIGVVVLWFRNGPSRKTAREPLFVRQSDSFKNARDPFADPRGASTTNVAA